MHPGTITKSVLEYSPLKATYGHINIGQSGVLRPSLLNLILMILVSKVEVLRTPICPILTWPWVAFTTVTPFFLSLRFFGITIPYRIHNKMGRDIFFLFLTFRVEFLKPYEVVKQQELHHIVYH